MIAKYLVSSKAIFIVMFLSLAIHYGKENVKPPKKI